MLGASGAARASLGQMSPFSQGSDQFNTDAQSAVSSPVFYILTVLAAGWLAAWLPDVSHSGGSMISARGNLDALAGNKTLGLRGETAAAVNVLVKLR